MSDVSTLDKVNSGIGAAYSAGQALAEAADQKTIGKFVSRFNIFSTFTLELAKVAAGYKNGAGQDQDAALYYCRGVYL